MTDWSTLISFLDALGAQERPCVGFIQLNDKLASDLSVDHIADLVRDSSRAYDGGIDQTIVEWTPGELLPECGWMATAWRGQRISSARAFLLFLDPYSRHQGTSLFCRKPNMSHKHAIQWLLIDWWYACGTRWHATWIKAVASGPHNPKPPSF